MPGVFTTAKALDIKMRCIYLRFYFNLLLHKGNYNDLNKSSTTKLLSCHVKFLVYKT